MHRDGEGRPDAHASEPGRRRCKVMLRKAEGPRESESLPPPWHSLSTFALPRLDHARRWRDWLCIGTAKAVRMRTQASPAAALQGDAPQGRRAARERELAAAMAQPFHLRPAPSRSCATLARLAMHRDGEGRPDAHASEPGRRRCKVMLRKAEGPRGSESLPPPWHTLSTLALPRFAPSIVPEYI
ncbi:hypothetical protein D6851_15885 [Altericroceibacterium spongiae]|uniref:Uncharacterized protein n=2 Tax=Altericroceibacterium spongiae TaxID=2320269 RepID=A0A420EAK7_9SPHN|nr:hypothetical protein D6851_15885 [Altericroceibacterium spongiae]